jgi:hypothetical protein
MSQPENYSLPRDRDAWNKLIMFGCLIPMFGVIPAATTLYRRHGDPEQMSVARLSILLGLVWFLTNLTLNFTGNELGLASESSFRLLFVNGLITSGYFIVNLGLVMRLATGKSMRLPGFSQIADRTF